MSKMKKDELYTHNNNMIIEMRDHIIRSGIKEEELNKFISIFDDAKKPTLEQIFKDLKKIREAWQGVEYVWTLKHMTPERWEMYEVFDMGGAREVRMLEDALKNLKNSSKEVLKKWRKQHSQKSVKQ